MPPTATTMTASTATPTSGRRQDRVQIVTTKSTAHITAASARMPLVGMTAFASVYWMPVIRLDCAVARL